MKSELAEWRLVAYLSLTLFVFLNDMPVIIFAQQPGKVYIYSFRESPSLETLLGYFNNRSDLEVILHDLNDSATSERFVKMVELFKVLGIEVMPPGSCLPCELKYLTWTEILMLYSLPVTGIFRNGRLTAVTIGTIDPGILDQAIMVNGEHVKVFTAYNVYVWSDESVRVRLEESFTGQEASNGAKMNLLNLISPIVFLALADSLNPCTFAVFTALLFIALYSFDRMKAAATGLSFILAIFIGYYALGLGLSQFLVAIPNINKALAVVGLVMGALSITSGLKPKFESPIPKSIRSFIELRIGRSYTSAVASFALGLVATFTLLPCTSGPYLVGLGLIVALKESIQVSLLLTLYNTIFVTPLIAILVAILASSRLSRKIKIFRSTKIGIMKLLSGTLLVAVCTYLLLL